MLVTACTQTQQAQPAPMVDSPEPAAEIAENSTEEQDKSPSDEEAQQPNEEKKHVCSGLMSCKMGLCPNGKKKQQANTEKETAEAETKQAENESVREDVRPSKEQMAAAHKIMQEQKATAPSPAKPTVKATVVAEPEPIQIDEPLPVTTVNNTSGIPGRSGLRMGRFAPPEEAASKNADTPQPNAAERHGLRSPKLPESLPMDIDGKTTH